MWKYLEKSQRDTWLEIDLLEYPEVHLYLLDEFFCVNVDLCGSGKVFCARENEKVEIFIIFIVFSGM